MARFGPDRRRLDHADGAQRRRSALPVALLSALVVVEAVAQGRHLQVDRARLAGVAVAAVAVWRRAPFLVVVVLAGLTAALFRLA